MFYLVFKQSNVLIIVASINKVKNQNRKKIKRKDVVRISNIPFLISLLNVF